MLNWKHIIEPDKDRQLIAEDAKLGSFLTEQS